MHPTAILERCPGGEVIAEKALSEREAASNPAGTASAWFAFESAFLLGLAAWRRGVDPREDLSRAIGYARRAVRLADLPNGPGTAWKYFPRFTLAAFAQYLLEGAVASEFVSRFVDWRPWKGSFNEYMWPAMDACLLQVLLGTATTADYEGIIDRIANRKKTATSHLLEVGYRDLIVACDRGGEELDAAVDRMAFFWGERSRGRDFQVNFHHEGPGEWNAFVVDFRCAAILKARGRTAAVQAARPEFPHVWRWS